MARRRQSVQVWVGRRLFSGPTLEVSPTLSAVRPMAWPGRCGHSRIVAWQYANRLEDGLGKRKISNTLFFTRGVRTAAAGRISGVCSIVEHTPVPPHRNILLLVQRMNRVGRSHFLTLQSQDEGCSTCATRESTSSVEHPVIGLAETKRKSS